MEDFSQSRGDDDLFDDEIVPFDAPSSPEKITSQLEQVSLEPSPAPPPVDSVPVPVPISVPAVVSAVSPASTEPPLPGSRGKPRGRGGQVSTRGGTSKKNSLAESKWATNPANTTSTEPSTNEVSVRPPSKHDAEEEPTTETPIPPEDTTSSPTAPSPPSGPANPHANIRPPAVRGDRTATGGVRKPKLTDEELSAKLAAAKERSQNLAAAHARAQADAASFEERERIAKEKREKDRVERRVMEGERERNRQRKMAVMGGREWDREKSEEEFKINGRGGGRRGYAVGSGMTPGQMYQAEQDDLKMYEWHDDRGRGRGRGMGRGGRPGRGRGRGGARGGGSGSETDGGAQQRQPDLSAEADFPALPGPQAGAKKNAADTNASKPKPSPQRWDSEGLGDGRGSWAEQVENSEATRTETTSNLKNS